MKIFVDATALVRKQNDGVARYTKCLINAFVNLPKNNYSLYRVGFIDDQGIVEQKLLIPRKVFNKLYGILPLLNSNKSVLGLYTNFVIFPFRAKKSVVVIHDLVFMDRPNEVAPKNLLYLKKHVPRSLSMAVAIICVSEFTKHRLLHHFDVEPSKVYVVPGAVYANDFISPSKQALLNVQRNYSLPDKYVLCFGSLEPRKNIEKSLDAYTLLSEKIRKDNSLVIAGGKGWLNKHIRAKINSLRSEGYSIHTPGYIPEKHVPELYAGASVLMFPSKYEGFGLPILEAQASGVPVVTSDRSPMKEIAGRAALFANPNDPDSISKSLEALLTNKKLSSKLSLSGKKNVLNFTWDKSAKKLKEVFDTLV